MTRNLLLCLLVLFLQACSAISPRPGSLSDEQYQAREQQLSERTSWSINGKLSLDDGQDGGSGVLNWHKQGPAQQMQFHGALGRGAWSLDATEAAAVLKTADGKESRADSVDELVLSELGEGVPVSALAWWVRGLAAPGDVTAMNFDQAGLPVDLRQLGWHVEFGRYREVDQFLLPHRLTARKGEWTVKLAIRSWSLDG